MRAIYPDLVARSTPSVVKWAGSLVPAPLCATYQVRITYRLSESPCVYVLDPPLRPRGEDEPVPHLYSWEKGELCLYLPRAKEWRRHMYIADTIVPWAQLWLVFYEQWRATGTWMGGGVHISE